MKKLFLFILLPFLLNAQESPKLNIVQYPWPPYQVDSVNGYCTELARETFDWLEVDYTIEELRCQMVAEKALQIKRYDALIAVGKDDKDQKEYLSSSEPFITCEWFLWGDNSSSVKSFEDLQGKPIAITQGVLYNQEFLKTAGSNFKVKLVENEQDAFKLFQDGEIVGFASEKRTVMYFNEENDANLVQLIPSPIANYTIGIVFSKRTIQQELIDAFSETLREIKASEFGEELRKKWHIE